VNLPRDPYGFDRNLDLDSKIQNILYFVGSIIQTIISGYQ
jgi:hypothetical protein